jgi:hypothetical protein
MIREGHEAVDFFVGTEVEHTPAFGKRTLFVVGVQNIEIIKWKLGETDRRSREPIKHIYFGANMSFPQHDGFDLDEFQPWEDMIKPFLAAGYLCTLDFDVLHAEILAESSLTEKSNFIPMISVKVPYLQLLGYNATIKLDDKDFDATNPGVWCHSVHDLMSRDKFTSWAEYTKDEVLK